MEHKFKLGSKLRDIVSGMTGITKSRIEYLNGCIQYSIQPPVGPDNKYPESYWFDVDQLELVDEGIYIEKKTKGGPENKACNYNG